MEISTYFWLYGLSSYPQIGSMGRMLRDPSQHHTRDLSLKCLLQPMGKHNSASLFTLDNGSQLCQPTEHRWLVHQRSDLRIMGLYVLGHGPVCFDELILAFSSITDHTKLLSYSFALTQSSCSWESRLNCQCCLVYWDGLSVYHFTHNVCQAEIIFCWQDWAEFQLTLAPFSSILALSVSCPTLYDTPKETKILNFMSKGKHLKNVGNYIYHDYIHGTQYMHSSQNSYVMICISLL